MNAVKKYNEARKKIEYRFQGLPHIHTTLIKSLITLADPTTGVVSNISYHELAKLLTIDPAPGRKGAGMPQKETIRSYLRTIAENSPEDFKLITQGQKLKVQFPNLPKIYAYFFDKEKGYTDENGNIDIDNSLENIEIQVDEVQFSGREALPVSPISATPVKKLFININNKHNKQTGTSSTENSKRFITQDFKPTQDTIDTALSRGFTQVLDAQELQKFIAYNQDNNCLWADFNPVFLTWLERGSEYQQLKKQQTKAKGHTRSGGYERTTHKSNTFEQLMEQVRRDNPDALAPSESFPESPQFAHLFDLPAHCVALGSADQHIRPAFPQ